jgi:hypothetical protein
MSNTVVCNCKFVTRHYYLFWKITYDLIWNFGKILGHNRIVSHSRQFLYILNYDNLIHILTYVCHIHPNQVSICSLMAAIELATKYIYYASTILLLWMP